jgi:hypothetical protein
MLAILKGWGREMGVIGGFLAGWIWVNDAQVESHTHGMLSGFHSMLKIHKSEPWGLKTRQPSHISKLKHAPP